MLCCFERIRRIQNLEESLRSPRESRLQFDATVPCFSRGAFLSLLGLAALVCVSPSRAAERDADAARQAVLNSAAEDVKPGVVSDLPDLTKGELIPESQHGESGPITMNIGATGIVGIKNGGFAGSQIRVVNVAEGSPAHGKVLVGDVLLGVAGKDFVPGEHMGVALGNAIIKAEEPSQKGLLQLHIWRDKNWAARFGKKDVYGLNLEDVFRKAEEDITLYDWEGEETKESRRLKESYDEYPLDPVELDVELKLDVMGTYSDTSPYDCEVADKIRENALKVVASRVGVKDRRGRVKGSWPEVLALVASGKPEYLEQAKAWVRTRKLEDDMQRDVTLADLRSGSSWFHGFNSLEMAIYYDATKDSTVLPEIRKRAIQVAMGQNGGGTWGHGFAMPGFNGGLLHKSNPGYGAMNNSGTRCFFFLTLAQKHGVDHFEVNDAIARSRKFFRTYVDKGAVPYGYHGPVLKDSSNGKNYGAAYGLYVLGEKYNGKYFSLNSTHAAFSRRGGHGSPTLWYYSPLTPVISGPKAVQVSMRNMRWFYTLARRFDGSFVFQGEQVGIGGKGMRAPTATHVLYYSTPLEKLIITGKDMDPKFWLTDEEWDEMMLSAREQCKDPALLARHGKPWRERSTSELLDHLDHFYVKRRLEIAKELAERYRAGEAGIKGEVVTRLSDPEARMREGACRALAAMGREDVLSSLSSVVALLKDDAEFVRTTAIKTIGGATDAGDRAREKELLQAVVDPFENLTMDNGNIHAAVKGVLFGKAANSKKNGPRSLLATEPFKAGYDEDLVGHALERIVTMDPGGYTPGSWSKDTLVRLAGPVTFSAEEYQINDAMFAGARKSMAYNLLKKHGYREAAGSDAANLRKRFELNRLTRSRVSFKAPYLTPSKVLQSPSSYVPQLEYLYQMLTDNPVHQFVEKKKVGATTVRLPTPLTQLITVIEQAQGAAPEPTIHGDVGRMFHAELKAAGAAGEQIKLCRKELKGSIPQEFLPESARDDSPDGDARCRFARRNRAVSRA